MTVGRLWAPVLVALAIAHTFTFSTVPWSLSQLVKALWPMNSPFAERVQQRCWDAWEREVQDLDMAPEPLDEVDLDATPTPSLSRPFIIRGLLNGSSSAFAGEYEWLLREPVGALAVDYFSNASADDGVVPDARAPLRDIVRRIVAGGSEKVGTEMVFRTYPWLLADLLGDRKERVARLLGSTAHTSASRVGTTLTVPVFMATGAPRARTDLHCEPIGNLALMLGGRKRWTLVEADQSRFLRPTLSPDGRAYFYSKQPTEEPEQVLRHVRRSVVDAVHGDAIWMPAWTWHRVDYYPEVTALSVSLFHVRLEQMLAQNPLFTLLVVPNMVKELIGWKTQ